MTIAVDLAADLRAFDGFGAKTLCFEQDGIPYFVNEFWTSGQRRAHSLHEISYRACFKPQLPEFFIKRLTAPGDGVYDPFMGRGTTPLQAALMGRRPLGNDMNPLSALLTRPRLAPPTLAEIEARLCEDRLEQGRDRARRSARLLSRGHAAENLRAAKLVFRATIASRSTNGSRWWRSTGSPAIRRGFSRSTRCRPTRPCRWRRS